MMLQNNISFDAFHGYVIDPYSYKLFEVLNGLLGTQNNQLPPGLHSGIFQMVKDYVDKLEPQNKNDYKQNMYFMIMHCLLTLLECNVSLVEIMQPQNEKHYFLLRLYLIPLLDLLTEIQPKSAEFNSFAHDYLLNSEINPETKNIYIVENYNEPTIRIIWIQSDDISSYLVQNNVSLNISGALFKIHNVKEGLVYKFLEDRLGMRKQYKNKMYEFEVGSEDYTFYNRRQLAMKVNANSTYGLSGLNTFRFSNKHLAKAITVSGRLCLKTAQICGELYLKDKYE